MSLVSFSSLPVLLTTIKTLASTQLTALLAQANVHWVDDFRQAIEVAQTLQTRFQTWEDQIRDSLNRLESIKNSLTSGELTNEVDTFTGLIQEVITKIDNLEKTEFRPRAKRGFTFNPTGNV